MKNIRLAERLFNTPLMVTEAKLNVILRVLGPRFNLDVGSLPDMEAREVTDRERRQSGYHVRNGIAVIPVHGTLVQRAGWLDAESGICSYESIRRALDTAMEDDAVLQVALDIDSPGGEVCGVFDLADHIYQSRGRKTITALVNEQACSAAYLIGSSAQKVIITRTAAAGSIGVIATHTEFSRWENETGITVTHVFAGARKKDFTPHEPLSEEAADILQGMVNDTYNLFVDTVARNRGISKETVRKTEAGVYVGKKAVAAGLADEVAPIDKTLARLAKQKGGISMPGTAAEGAAPEQAAAVTETAVEEPRTYTQAELDAAIQTAVQESQATHAAAVETARQEAASAERSRITAIHAACKENGAEALFAGLVEDGATEDAAGKRILDALALRSESQDIVSRHGGGQKAKSAIDHQAALKNT